MTATVPTETAQATGKAAIGVCVDDRANRDRVCSLLVAGGHAIHARARSADDLIESCNGITPGCVVTSAYRPDRDALELVRVLRGSLDGVSVVLCCERAGAGEVRRALELGVDGLVLSEDLERALAPVVATVCAGQVTVPHGRRGIVRGQVLTAREKQILGLVVMGLTNAEIAGKLFLAESTVKSHLSSAFSKLGVSSRNEAVGIILDPERGRGLGILTIPSERVPTSA